MAKTLISVLSVALLCTLLAGPIPAPYGAQEACAQASQPAQPSQTAQPGAEKPAQGKIAFKGGTGETMETAVVITGAANTKKGIDAEHYYLHKTFGPRNKAWKLERQSVLRDKGKVYDRMEIELKGGAKKSIFFDITEFFGKL